MLCYFDDEGTAPCLIVTPSPAYPHPLPPPPPATQPPLSKQTSTPPASPRTIKSNIQNIQVFCNGEEVMRCGGTQAEYVVDIWSGNHPFFLVGPRRALTPPDPQLAIAERRLMPSWFQ